MGKIYLPQCVVSDEAFSEYLAFGVRENDDLVDADAIIPRMMRLTHAAVIPSALMRRERPHYAVEGGSAGGEPENNHPPALRLSWISFPASSSQFVWRTRLAAGDTAMAA